jgi:hypothetical protein
VCPACGVEDAQIDLRPWILVTADDDARSVHIYEEDSAVGRALAKDVVFDREVEIRVAAAGDVALQLVCGIGELLRERGVVSGDALSRISQSRASREATEGISWSKT